MDATRGINHQLCNQLLYESRPKEVQDKIDQVHESLVRRGFSDWGHNGTIGFYHLLNFAEEEVIAQRIEQAWPKDKKLVFIDLGAGQFGWVDAVKSYLRREYKDSEHQFQVIGVTGEGEPFDATAVDGNITTHKIRGFKLENLLESFNALGFKLENSAQYIVTAWTLQHLVDPIGTLEQAYHLLDRNGGFLFGMGFIHANPHSGPHGFGTMLGEALGVHGYIVKEAEGVPRFAVYRDNEYRHSHARDHFSYKVSSPLIELDGGCDSFAGCVAELQVQHAADHNSEFGGNFYGFGSFLLEKLIGYGKKRVVYNGLVSQVPLFGIRCSTNARKLYLDANNYEVEVRKPEALPEGSTEIPMSFR